MSEIAHQNHVEKKAFLVNSSSLKDVRNFCREVFEKLHIQEDLKDELVLAIAEAAQNIVKHAFKNAANANELMVVQISCENNKLQIAFYDRGTPVDPKKVKHREIDNVKPGGLGTFFIQEIMDAVEFKDGKKPWINHLVLTKQL
jgi:serine/threonine-protein kinase RsbW